MTPQQLLAVWRQRWGKPSPSLLQPYLNGGLGDWGRRSNGVAIFSNPLFVGLAVVLFLALNGVLVNVPFTPVNHWWFSTCVLVVSLFIRPYRGSLITLVLTGLAWLSVLRYVYWRWDATLQPAYSVDYFVALALWVIELYGVVWCGLGLLQAFAPLRRKAQDLTENEATWPSVNLFVSGAQATEQEVLHSVAAMKQLKWPQEKIDLTVLDDTDRVNLRVALAELNVTYLPSLNPADTTLNHQINRAITDAEGELVVVVQAGQAPQPDVLLQSVAWLMEDDRLGLLMTPHHFLLPACDQKQFKTPLLSDCGAEILITRVSLFLKAGGLPTGAASDDDHLPLRMLQAGAGHAYWVREAHLHGLLLEPFAQRSWRGRTAVAHLRHTLGFGQPLLRLTLWAVPLIYLLGDVLPMKASVWVWLAYVTPAVLQVLVLLSRTPSSGQWDAMAVVKEALLALYVWGLTLFTVLWTSLKTSFSRTASKPEHLSGQAFELNLFDYLSLLLHGVAIVVAVSLMGQADPAQRATLGLYLVWSVAIEWMLMAKLAVVKEAAEVLRQQQRLQVLPAMLRLANNRTLSCHTLNFPATEMRLQLPAALTVSEGQRLKLSIFHEQEELAVDVKVVSLVDTALTVKLEPVWQSVFERFSQAVFARGADWPAWLPSQHVDQLVPPWVPQFFTWLGSFFSRAVPRMARKSAAQVAGSGQDQ
ncbi:MAG: hypothetical protein PHQ13_12205 [Rhodoferax sp.]|nr:hypothetical protein [Rhodoferax sp.]